MWTDSSRRDSSVSARRAAWGRWISIVGHPFIVMPVAILVASADGGSTSVPVPVLVAVGLMMAVLALYIARQMKRGEATDVDVSKRSDRPRVYFVAIVAAITATAFLYVRELESPATRGLAVTTGLFLVCAIANSWIKVSLHSAFAMLAAGIVWPAHPAIGWLFAGAAPVIAWGRVAYGRHTWKEVALGLALGALAAMVYDR